MDLIISQLTDIFRIGLIIGLVITMQRTALVTGRVIPLILGVVFIAAMLPMTMPSSSVKLQDAILAGLISNSILLVAVLAGVWLISRFRR